MHTHKRRHWTLTRGCAYCVQKYTGGRIRRGFWKPWSSLHFKKYTCGEIPRGRFETLNELKFRKQIRAGIYDGVVFEPWLSRNFPENTCGNIRRGCFQTVTWPKFWKIYGRGDTAGSFWNGENVEFSKVYVRGNTTGSFWNLERAEISKKIRAGIYDGVVFKLWLGRNFEKYTDGEIRRGHFETVKKLKF